MARTQPDAKGTGDVRIIVSANRQVPMKFCLWKRRTDRTEGVLDVCGVEMMAAFFARLDPRNSIRRRRVNLFDQARIGDLKPQSLIQIGLASLLPTVLVERFGHSGTQPTAPHSPHLRVRNRRSHLRMIRTRISSHYCVQIGPRQGPAWHNPTST